MALVFYTGGFPALTLVAADSTEVSTTGQSIFPNVDFFFFLNAPPAGLDRVIVSNQKAKTAGWVNGG